MKGKHTKKKRRAVSDTAGRKWIFLWIVFGVLAFDRITKWLSLRYLTNEISLIPGVLKLHFVVNTGAGFGILQGKTTLLAMITLIFLGVILYNIKKVLKESFYWAAALIVGGAFANLFDRIFFGFVIDFIMLPFWPVFNIADTALTSGVIVLLAWMIKDAVSKKEK